jgi:hypothetical protein
VKYSFIPILALILISYGCKKDSAKPTVDVYIAGEAANSATLWKNGIPTILSVFPESFANAVTVSGSDVYVAGDVPEAGQIEAVYWKNGSINNLAVGSARAIATNGTDVYVAGRTYGSNGVIDAVCWKNNSAINLGPGEAVAVTLSGNDVYVAGYTLDANQAEQATYWKNGQPTVLGPGNITAITIAGNDVYSAGFHFDAGDPYGVACYWKNSELVKFSGNVYFFDIKVSGSDVYLAGDTSDMHGEYSAYWKNKRVNVLDGGSILFDIALNGKDVYGVGWQNAADSRHSALFWKNNYGTTLSSGFNVFASANSVAIVQH